MNILVTGATGFLGVNTCRQLLENGHNVVGVDNQYTSALGNLEILTSEPNFQFIEQDIRENWDNLPKCEIVIQLACPASPVHYQKDPIFTWTTSVIGNLKAVDYARNHGSRIVFSSTSEVYGDPLVALQNEDYWGNVNPIGIRACYDEGKRAAESLLFDAKRFYGLDIRIARIFNTYGPGMAANDGRVVSNFIVQALTGKPLTIYGTGQQTRSFCFVEDTVSGLKALALNTEVGETPINLGNPDEITMLTLADTILDLTKSNSEIKFVDLPEDDPKIRRPDISRARKQLHWDPTINLREGIAQTIEYFKTVAL
jgi:UDP-glucuronate decarboxylase